MTTLAGSRPIRHQHGQLGKEGIPVPGRPYALHAGDHIQVRHTINHPDHGQLRNGTAATITAIHGESREVVARLSGGSELNLNQYQVEQADVRLAYIQHPFPAQGHTTDTAHVIIAGHATREGTYVAITRARQPTHIYAFTDRRSSDGDPLERLATRISYTEPEVPSITTPLQHEAKVNLTADAQCPPHRVERTAPEPLSEWNQPSVDGLGACEAAVASGRGTTSNVSETAQHAPADLVHGDLTIGRSVPAPGARNAGQDRWPFRVSDVRPHEDKVNHREVDETRGWEP